MDLAQIILPIGGREKLPAGLEHTVDFCQRFGAVGNMVEHVVGNHGVKAVVIKGDLLRINHLEIKGAQPCKVALGFFDHAGRKIRERDFPTVRDARLVIFP